jgi:hypothetical protein
MLARASLRQFILGVGLFLTASFALAGDTRALVHDGVLDVIKATATEQTIQVVRELHLTHKVSFAVMTPEELAKMLAKGQSGDPPDYQVAATGAVGAMLGMFPNHIDLKAASVATLKNQLLAFYDFRSKKMVVIDSGDESTTSKIEGVLERSGQRDYLGYLILAHEFTHALQDQNFYVGDQLERLSGDSDRELAMRSVAEGDATLAGWGYALGKMDASTVAMLDSHVDDASKAYATNSEKDSLISFAYFNFPYTQGLRFVAEAYKRGGWSAVNDLYRKPPQSTAQIIDPSLYFDHTTLPLEVNLSGYQPLVKDWRVVSTDTNGELALQVILERNFGMTAREVGLARAWTGDRVVILQKDHNIAALWLIMFRDEASATAFGAVYTRVLDRTLHGAHTPHRVESHFNGVLVIVGPPARNSTLNRAIWEASTVRTPMLSGGMETSAGQTSVSILPVAPSHPTLLSRMMQAVRNCRIYQTH